MLVGKALRYSCSCGHSFDKYRNRDQFYEPIPCEKCATEIIYESAKSKSAKNYTIIGAKVQNAEYNPGLGTVVKNNQHKKEICKQKEIFEVGNDYGSGEKMQKEFEKKKKTEKEARWKKASHELGLRDE